MNKLLIGLLVIAAGTGALFYFNQKTCDKPGQVNKNSELIIGKWKPDISQPVKDSAQPSFRYEFQNAGIVYRTVSDSVKADTISYSWKDNDRLLIMEKPEDTTGVEFTIVKLTQDSLQVKGSDNTEVLFTKLK